MSVREDLLSAQESSDLGEVTDGLGDVDWLRASGMVARKYSTALAVWRLTEIGDRAMLRKAFDGLLAECVTLKLTVEPIHTVTHVLQWLLQRVCPACHGRKFELLPGAARHLSEKECGVCQGSGLRPKQGWGDAEHALHEHLMRQQGLAAAALKRKLG